MDNIEKALDNFFQRLGHTPGPWKYEDEYVRSSFLNGTDFGNIVADTGIRPYAQFEKEENANGVLVAQSPAMLRTLCRTYLWMLTNLTYGSPTAMFRIKAQEALADLRNQISQATGIECQEVQETFEQYAIWIQVGADVDEQIKEQAEKDDMMIKEEPADQRDPETKVFNAMENGAEDWDNRP